MDKLINPGVCNFADLRSSQFREQLVLQNRLVIGKSASLFLYTNYLTTQTFYIEKFPLKNEWEKCKFGVNYGIFRQKKHIVTIIG